MGKRTLCGLLVIIGIIFSAFSVNWVEVENDLTYYLPSGSETKLGIEVMEEEFLTYGTAQIMVANVTYARAEELYQDISAIKGVQSVMFDNSTGHYQNASALFTVTFDYEQYDTRCETALNLIKDKLKGYEVMSLVQYDI